ncbi:CoA ester lyase [Aeromicrobium sp. 50.2.37]|uniref:HpcH/HpaI aldolase/citrate lyase family protein n=1 Tax=Aeromicrobium sp. 50.2.37 TaxID=2969305 RepID=UPI00214F83CD|nr:CoA ester lyase [Aeromicrobium sp. 50.2.37]MCR4514056.1 CoA ester lyase [Aeromicrobium sp. 50.2.37]
MLFAPASEPRKVAATGRFGADLVVLDLEDAVADARKDDARAAAAEHLRGTSRTGPVAVRVNAVSTPWFEDDLAAVAAAGADAVVVPKVEDPDLVAHVRSVVGAVPVVALLETATGVLDAAQVCRSGRPDLVVVGTGDLAAELDITLTPDADELLHARSHVVLACRAAGLPAPLDGPFLALDAPDDLARASRASRALGFQGRVVVHPPQLTQVHAAYGEPDLELQRRIVREFEAAQAEGLASIRVGEIFVDYPTYHTALRRIAAEDTTESTRNP